MVRGKKNAIVEYRGHRATVRAIDSWHCPARGEVEFAGKEGTRYAEALDKLRLKIDAEESAELARIRKKLNLSQRRTAAIAGGAPTFKVVKSLHAVSLLKNMMSRLDPAFSVL